jgi:CTP-dependent riboflavin kinase
MDARTRREHARGTIIKVLVAEYPNPVDSFLLQKLLDDFGVTVDSDALDSYLAYLEEDDYVTRDTTRAGITIVRATKKGCNLRDGYIKDPGVEVN